MDADRGARPRARRRRRRGQRARPVRAVPGPVARHLRVAGDAELPRDQELHLRRGRGAAHQRPPARRARRDHPREGHRPQPVLPRPGRQVHLGRRRLELPALRHPGGLPLRAARRHGRRSSAGGPLLGPLRPRSRGMGRERRRRGCRSCRPACEQAYHMFYLLMPSAAARQRLHRAPARAGHPRGVPLPAAAPLADGPAARSGEPSVPGDRRRQRPAACGCRSSPRCPTRSSTP